MSKYAKPKIKEVSQNVHLLTFTGSRKLYLIGTAHVSANSIKLVEDTINEVKPDTICVELDEKRYESIKKKNVYENINIIEIIKKKQLFFFIGQFIMASFQRKISDRTGSKPGEEFKKAIELAESTEAKLVLADRNIGTTLKRAWRLTPFLQKFKFLAGIFTASDEDIDDLNIEEMLAKDAIDSMVQTFAEDLPKTKEVLIDERDIYLTSEIQNNLGKTTVAVVGAGHVPGMLKQFDTEITADIKEEISFIPKPSKIGKIIPWIIPAVIVGVFIWGFFHGRREVALDFALIWILANGILTAIGCLLAFGHPITILAGFIAAPITSLNPTIGAGFVTAIVQTFIVKPRVKDIEQIQDKTLKLRHWWTNRITKIFLVFILSSLGSTIGTFVALPALTRFFS